jgi:hypothetical protein
MQTSNLAVAAIVALVAWRLYSRFRRMVGRQRYRPWRTAITLILFPVIVLLVGVGASAHTLALEALAGGLATGIALGVVGLRLTRYEATPLGRYYTPNAHIGIALSLLFAARIVWRAIELRSAGADFSAHAPDFARSALTLLVFGVLAGYYITYAAGLVRWVIGTPADAAPAESPAPPAPPSLPPG